MTTDADNSATDRDISELLALDTFQGMTDTEIQKVIDWNVERAHSDAETSAYRDAARKMSESHEQAVTAMLEDSQKTLELIRSHATEYGTVQPQAVANLLVEKGEV